MLDPVRAALLAHMGIAQWQLRRPELLALTGAAVAVAAEAASVDGGVQPGLWVWGPWQPWLADLALLLGLAPEACHPLQAEQWEQTLTLEGVLLLAAPPEQPSLMASHWLDGRLGKRALWQQLCDSGWLGEEPVDDFC